MSQIVTHLGANKNWIAYKLGDNSFVATCTQDSAAFDLSDYTFVLNIRRIGGSTNEKQLTEGNGITNGGATGVLTIELSKSVIEASLPGNDYWYELSYTKDSKVYAFLQGVLTLSSKANPGSTTTGVDVNVNLSGSSVSVAVTVGGGGSAQESKFTSNPTLVLPSGHTFGKYSNGDTPNWTGLTAIEAILDAITDYINAVFTSFSISGQSTTVEVGTTLSGSKTFTWAITENSSDVNDLDIYDITAAANIATATANDGSQAVNINSKQLNSNGATQQWRGVAHDDNNDNDINSTTYTVTARFYRFFGPAASSPADSAAVRALPSSAFHTGAGSFNFNTGTTQTKFVVALPPGVTISSVIDTDALGADITSEFVLTGTVNVQDAGGTNRAYNIYEMNVGVPYDSAHDFTITTAS